MQLTPYLSLVRHQPPPGSTQSIPLCLFQKEGWAGGETLHGWPHSCECPVHILRLQHLKLIPYTWTKWCSKHLLQTCIDSGIMAEMVVSNCSLKILCKTLSVLLQLRLTSPLLKKAQGGGSDPLTPCNKVWTRSGAPTISVLINKSPNNPRIKQSQGKNIFCSRHWARR